MLGTGYVLSALLGLGIVIVGIRFLLTPQAAAAGYGVEAPTGVGGAAFLQIKGVRDIASGLFVPVLIIAREPHPLAALMLLATITPLADCVIVLRHGGNRATAFGAHFATAVIMWVTAVLLFLG